MIVGSRERLSPYTGKFVVHFIAASANQLGLVGWCVGVELLYPRFLGSSKCRARRNSHFEIIREKQIERFSSLNG
jgi:hypothetical protein